MKPIFMFVLLIFGICLVIHSSVSRICGGEEYTIVYPNGTFKRCLPCAKCLPGRGLKPKCGSTVQHPPNIDCHSCEPGEFSSEFDSSSCLACHQCVKYQLITAHCTNKSDTVCSGKCKKGYYLSKTAPLICQECSSCCLDEKDEKIPECVNQGINKHCSARPDNVCGGSAGTGSVPGGSGPGTTDASKSGGLSIKTSVSMISGSITGVVVIALLVAAALWMYRRGKRNRPQNVEAQSEVVHVKFPNPAYEQRNETPSSPEAYASEGPQAEPTESKVTFMLPRTFENLTYQGTPRGSPRAATKPVPSHAKKQDNSSRNAASGSKNPGDEQMKLTDKKDINKPPLGRQVSQESQTSGDGEVNFRKRSFSARSFEMMEQKMSLKKENSLLESEEPDEPHEPIKISKHPKSQTVKQGSKVEFKCRVEKESKNLLYQWYKDGVAELGQNDTNLVLDPVELRHFGRYTCYVSYRDSDGESVASNPAKLDVTPQRQNGISPKLLSELDINTKDEIAALLGSKKFGLRNCRQVAARCDMEEGQIDALANSKEPGKDVLEYIFAYLPNLTVYEFCKILKEDKVKRFDIVKKLENHFLVSESTKNV